MKLSHLLLMILLSTLLVFPIAWLQTMAGIDASLEHRVQFGVVPAMLVAFCVASPIARWLRMPPLMVFSGPCPRCRQRPPGWWSSGHRTDRLDLACGACGQRVRVWLTAVRPEDIAPSDEPNYVLRWPQFLGVWRRVDAGG